MADQVAVAVSGGGAVAVAGLTKRFFNHIQKDFLINVWVYFHSLKYFELPLASPWMNPIDQMTLWIPQAGPAHQGS